ncbi:hypothetical protein P618_200515 [Holospora obtusa F1]|uniref:Uncharacterized protein n=1 Tax=Holospora obtusa F1 TaxID=1399147 RepID=W6TU73_HOLOB|nr:hypothetical protein P618_200515 [Holospora obtusa F1]
MQGGMEYLEFLFRISARMLKDKKCSTKASRVVERLVSHSYGITYKELKEANVWEVYCMKMPRRRFESEKKYKALYRALQK